MKSIIFVSTFIMLFSCGNNKSGSDEVSYPATLMIGTYTGSKSQGIYKYQLHENGEIDSIKLMARIENPSFLAFSHDRKYLLSVSDTLSDDNPGYIVSFRVTDDSLLFLSRTTSGGANPCFVAVNENGFAAAANYKSGNVGLVKMDENGFLSGLLDLKQHVGNGITDRQKGPHAHSVWFGPSGDGVISVDLGTDDLWLYSLDKEKSTLIPSDPPVLSMSPGAGPRHLAFHPNKRWIYVVNELDCTVTHVERNEQGKYEVKASWSTLPDNFTDANSCADIHVSPDGNFVYASNRGHNSIAIFESDPGNGSLKAIGHQSVHGSTPRNFAISPDGAFLLVANQRSDNIVSFRRDQKTGDLTYLGEVNAPSPVCIKFF